MTAAQNSLQGRSLSTSRLGQSRAIVQMAPGHAAERARSTTEIGEWRRRRRASDAFASGQRERWTLRSASRARTDQLVPITFAPLDCFCSTRQGSSGSASDRLTRAAIDSGARATCQFAGASLSTARNRCLSHRKTAIARLHRRHRPGDGRSRIRARAERTSKEPAGPPASATVAADGPWAGASRR